MTGPEPARSRMERTAKAALPVLERVLRSRWPRDFEPRIVIVPSRAQAEGELGFFDVAKKEIRVVKEVPSWLLVHELAHGWYGAPFSHDRTANEGRATAAALRVLHARPDLGDEEWLRASLLRTAGSVPERDLKEPPSPLPAGWTEADERRKNAFYARAWLDAEKSADFETVPPRRESDQRVSTGSVPGTGDIVKVEGRADGSMIELAISTRSGFEREDTFWNFDISLGESRHVAGFGRTVDPWIGEATGVADPTLVEWRPLHRSRVKLEGSRAVLSIPRNMLGPGGRSAIGIRGYIVRGEKRLEETTPLTIE